MSLPVGEFPASPSRPGLTHTIRPPAFPLWPESQASWDDGESLHLKSLLFSRACKTQVLLAQNKAWDMGVFVNP